MSNVTLNSLLQIQQSGKYVAPFLNGVFSFQQVFFSPPDANAFFEVEARGLYGASVRLKSLLAGYCSESF